MYDGFWIVWKKTSANFQQLHLPFRDIAVSHGQQSEKNAFVTFNYYRSALGNESVGLKIETDITIILQQNQRSTDSLIYTNCEIYPT